ncbi:MAG: hypothetical protein AW08_01511 [Candidatus Accumulibacter adjunctus]|uniref:Uncharacterized protein n=1 Tax=Candidatus Accumulibacter adjunctus TaxID=1454001 RepID=A0A011NTK2_9PROT|nr:MAG: hypothetical protein AW08_01511 [Candidatus Accumulibacter adjunctus]
MNTLAGTSDRITRVALFGARFLDTATGAPVAEGLRVSLFPTGRPEARADAFVTRGGMFARERIPGFGTLDFGNGVEIVPDLGAGDKTYWEKAAAADRPYVVEVRDRLNRFLPVSFRTTIPTPGPFGTGGPGSGLPEARKLFSAPARLAPPSTAVLRAELREPKSADYPDGRPLKHALFIVECGGKPAGTGIADGDGRAAVMFSYPEPPPTSRGAARNKFCWPISVKVYHARLAAPAADRPSKLPDIEDLLAQEKDSLRLKVFKSLAPDPVEELDVLKLELGQELVLRTSGWSCLFASSSSA